MAAKDSQSKRPSAASSPWNKLPESPVFFLDHCLGRYVVAEALRAAGESVELHCQHFEPTASDIEWLPVVGRRGWVILTKDRHMKSNQIEIIGLINAQAACFNLVSAEMTGAEMAESFVSALPHIKRMLAKMDRPFVANISRTGTVDLLYRYSDFLKKLP